LCTPAFCGGFLGHIGRFPLGSGFISEVKEVPFCTGKAGTVDVTIRSVKPDRTNRNVGASKDGLYTGTMLGAYIPG